MGVMTCEFFTLELEVEILILSLKMYFQLNFRMEYNSPKRQTQQIVSVFLSLLNCYTLQWLKSLNVLSFAFFEGFDIGLAENMRTDIEFILRGNLGHTNLSFQITLQW